MSALNDKSVPRRSLLAYIASATGLLGLDSLAVLGKASAQRTAARPAATKAKDNPAPAAPYDLQLAQLRDDKTMRSSSYDRIGGNRDSVTIDPGQTITVLDAAGPGVVTHLWFTVQSGESSHLKTHVLRAFWDGEPTPSVEVPLGDFFGLGLGEYFLYQSALTNVAPIKALNAYFPMPFRSSARITVTNEGQYRTSNFYFNIDFHGVASLPEDVGYFHAQYRQQIPTAGVNNQPLNLTGAENYVFMEATGRGHLVGVFQAVLQNQDGWMGEGDEMIFIDGDPQPAIHGTGTEDYFGGGWNFGARLGAVPFSYPLIGAPLIQNPEVAGGRIVMYRWHVDNPVRFQRSLKMTIEHGSGNDRSDNYYTVAYWYQSEPHAAFPALPPAAARVPHLYVAAPGSVPMSTPAPAPRGPERPTAANPSPTTMSPPPGPDTQ
jgi:hypothetical protein